MNVCYDCGEKATRVQIGPFIPEDRHFYCDVDGWYMDKYDIPTIPIKEAQ